MFHFTWRGSSAGKDDQKRIADGLGVFDDDISGDATDGVVPGAVQDAPFDGGCDV